MLKLRQKVAEIEGKRIAFVETIIFDGTYTYNVQFDKHTKKRFNKLLRKLGFIVGEVPSDAEIPEKEWHS